MDHRKFSYLSVFVVLFMALVIAGYYFNEAKQTSVVTMIQGNYDTVMRDDKFGQNEKAPINYYTLALSWSPGFCDVQKQRTQGGLPPHLQYQCSGIQQFGWVIHGLWPQNARARKIAEHPRFCQGDLAELPPQLIEKYLPESPSATLLQGQWEKHGACAFKNAEPYFAKQKALFLDLVLPKYELAKRDLFKWVKDNNPQLKGAYLGGGRNELFICYDLRWNPMDCPRTQYQ